MAKEIWNRTRTLGSHYTIQSAEAWTTGSCISCGTGVQMGVIAHRAHPENADIADAQWMMCVSCRQPYLRVGASTWPAARQLSSPKHLDPDVSTAWEEVVGCIAIGAFTSAAMMCRKILLHIAVANGLAPEDSNGWAPNFRVVVDFLVSSGVASPRMAPWVDQIRSGGNDAAHKLPATSADEANNLATFTQQLLVLNYEIPGMIPTAGDSSGTREPGEEVGTAS